MQCVIDFKSVSDSIQPSVRGLFEGRIRETYQNFLPGLNKFAWNSTNIGEVDALNTASLVYGLAGKLTD